MIAIPAKRTWREAVDGLREGLGEVFKRWKVAKEMVDPGDIESLIAYVEVLRVRSICPTCGLTVAECERTKTVCR